MKPDPFRISALDTSGDALSRQDEAKIAATMRRSRKRFRSCLIANECVLRSVIDMLEGIESGRLRLDRFIDLAVTDLDGKQRVRSMLGSVLSELKSIREQNRRWFLVAVSRRSTQAKRRNAWESVVRGRYRAAMLIDTISLRTNKFASLLHTVRMIQAEMERLQSLLQFARNERADCRVVHRIRRELRALMLENLDSPATMQRRLSIIDKHRNEYLGHRQRLAITNQRFVVMVARRYRHQGLAIADLVQEGTVGLLRAIEKFDPSRGFRLMTYAERWIRQEIIVAIARVGGAMSFPSTLNKSIRQVRVSKSSLVQSTGREPSTEEIAALAGLSVRQTEDIVRLGRKPLSLDHRLRSGDRQTFVDIVEHRQNPYSGSEERQASIRQRIHEVLEVLNPREREILLLRYGLNDGVERTLAEIGKRFCLTKERIRQIQKRAVQKLQRPVCRNTLADFVEDWPQVEPSSPGKPK